MAVSPRNARRPLRLSDRLCRRNRHRARTIFEIHQSALRSVSWPAFGAVVRVRMVNRIEANLHECRVLAAPSPKLTGIFEVLDARKNRASSKIPGHLRRRPGIFELVVFEDGPNLRRYGRAELPHLRTFAPSSKPPAPFFGRKRRNVGTA